MVDINNAIALGVQPVKPPDVVGQITSLAQLQYLAAQGQAAQANAALAGQNVQLGQYNLNSIQDLQDQVRGGTSVEQALPNSLYNIVNPEKANQILANKGTSLTLAGREGYAKNPTDPLSAAAGGPDLVSTAATAGKTMADTTTANLENTGRIGLSQNPSSLPAAALEGGAAGVGTITTAGKTRADTALANQEIQGRTALAGDPSSLSGAALAGGPGGIASVASAGQTQAETSLKNQQLKGQLANELLASVAPDGSIPPQVKEDAIQKAVQAKLISPGTGISAMRWPDQQLLLVAKGWSAGGQSSGDYSVNSGTTAGNQEAAKAPFTQLKTNPDEGLIIGPGLAKGMGYPNGVPSVGPFNGLPATPLSPSAGPGLTDVGRTLGPPGLAPAAIPPVPPIVGTVRNANEIPPNMIGPAAPSAGGTRGVTKAQVLADNAQGARTIAQREAVQPTAIMNAIHGQEGGGASSSPVSVDNAHTTWQVTPGFFKQFGPQGGNINNEADAKAAAANGINAYSRAYNGDPERVAVAYFSGPGNVSPPGAPTPWKTDAVDGNGKRTSSYVADIMGRLGQSPTVTGGFSPAGPVHTIAPSDFGPAGGIANPTQLATAAAIPVPPSLLSAPPRAATQPPPTAGTVAPIVPSPTNAPVPTPPAPQVASAAPGLPAAPVVAPAPGVTAPRTGLPADQAALLAPPVVSPGGAVQIQPGMTLSQKAELESQGKVYGELPAQFDTAATSAKTMNATLDEVAQAAASGAWTPGKWAPFAESTREGLQSVAKSLGIATPGLDQSITDYQDFVKMAGNISRSAAHETSSRVGVQEMQLINKSLPSPEMSEGGIGLVIPQMKGLNDFVIAKQQAAAGWRASNGNSLGPMPQSGGRDFQSYWNEQASPAAFVLHRMQTDNPDAAKTLVARMAAQPGGKAAIQSLIGEVKWAQTAGLLQ